MINNYKIVRRIRKSGTSLAVNIPQEIVEVMGLKEGSLVEIDIKKI